MAREGRRHDAELETMETIGGAHNSRAAIHKGNLRTVKCLDFHQRRGGEMDIAAAAKARKGRRHDAKLDTMETWGCIKQVRKYSPKEP